MEAEKPDIVGAAEGAEAKSAEARAHSKSGGWRTLETLLTYAAIAAAAALAVYAIYYLNANSGFNVDFFLTGKKVSALP
jgi:hypothetical protein